MMCLDNTYWCESGRYSCLDKNELRYARRMGWIKEEREVENY